MDSDKVTELAKAYDVFKADEAEKIDIGEVFNELSKDYDELYDKVDYNNSKKCAQMLDKHFSPELKREEAKILDLGCGTGGVAENMQKHGFKEFYGLDASTEMLKIAESKKIYRELSQCYLGSNSFPSKYMGQFDASTTAGVLTKHHAPAIAFEQIFGCLKKGGLGIFSIPDRYIEELGYKQQIDKMEAEGIVKFLHSEPFDNFTKVQGEEVFLKPTPTHVYVYVKL